MLHVTVRLHDGHYICTIFANYDTIINSKVEHLEFFYNMFTHYAPFGDGVVALCPL